ncbi:MAG: host factor-I protein [Candidatus Tokpelaia sp. JSC085]|nr:MAG: host factor-I protein [Candidatus Tokpelaia sp. JSC085]
MINIHDNEGIKMTDRPRPLQDRFLNAVIDDNPVTVFFVNGVKLTGTVTHFDNFSILLSREGCSQLLYKHAMLYQQSCQADRYG